MFHLYTIIILLLIVKCSIPIDTNKSLLRFTHHSTPNHNVLSSINETDQFNKRKITNIGMNILPNASKELRKRNVTVIIVVGCISVSIMTIIVVTLVAVTYFNNSIIAAADGNEHRIPLNSPRQLVLIPEASTSKHRVRRKTVSI